MSGKLLFFCGAEPKAGTTMASRSLAQYLSETGKCPVLWVSQSEEDCVFTPADLDGICLREAGVSYLDGFRWTGSAEHAREQFRWTVLDGGAWPLTEHTEGLAQQADCVILVAAQLAGSLSKAEQVQMDYGVLLLNYVRPGDPHDVKYVQKRLFDSAPEGKRPAVCCLPESEKGRQADWEGLTLIELRDRAYRRAVARLAQEVEQ